MLTPAAWLTLAVVVGVLTLLVTTRLPPEAGLLGGLTLLLVAGVVEPAQALSGFSNAGVLTVGALFVVAAGLQETGAVRVLATTLLGSKSSVRVALARLVVPTAVASAFLNNTPIVAALLPGITEWSRRHNIPASKLLMPLSYAAILGGTCTLLGTSTNLVVSGLLQDQLASRPDLRALSLLELGYVGLPLAIMGGLVLVGLGPILLPDRRPALSIEDDLDDFTAELRIPKGNPLIGKTIEDAGLRSLPNVYLAEVLRDGTLRAAVSPDEVLQEGDELIFVGAIESVRQLRVAHGLASVDDHQQPTRRLIQVVLGPGNPLLGRSIREGRFRTRFGAVVLAVARRMERIEGRLGDVVMQAGDVMLLEAAEDFARVHRNRREFFVVDHADGMPMLQRDKALAAGLVLAGMVGAAASGVLSMLEASFLAAGAMLATSCCNINQARRAVDTGLLVAIASAFGIGQAMQASGLAESVAAGVLNAGIQEPLLALALVYLATVVLTEMITNNAAAVLAFPLAVAVADQVGANPMPFIVAVMVAASASFLTPIGYQTNLMVFGPGGYRFGDYLRVGSILSSIAAATTLVVAPMIWPF